MWSLKLKIFSEYIKLRKILRDISIVGWLSSQQSSIWGGELRGIPIEEDGLDDIQKPISKRMKNLAEEEIERICWVSVNILINKIEELGLGDMITEKLELEDGLSQRTSEIHSESWWDANINQGSAYVRSIERPIKWIFA